MAERSTAASLLAAAAARLERAGLEAARLDASMLLSHVLGIPREKLLTQGGIMLEPSDEQAFEALLLRRERHEPLAYILGKKEFWSLDFFVTRDTLIPRPDTETLVEAALRRVQNRARPITLLDLGTGTGCLLVSLLKELPRSWGVGVDINERALKVAGDNARMHDVTDRALLVCGNWAETLNGTFELILSNPPYIPEGDVNGLMPDVAHYEPRRALAAGADGLDDYRTLAPQVARLLTPGGMAFFEVGKGQADDVAALLRAQGLSTLPHEPDLSGVARCVVARRIH